MDAGVSEAAQYLEIVASVSRDKLVIVFRKNISGIHQRLGEISLSQDDDQEIDTIAWVATAVQRADTVEKNVRNLQAKCQEQGETIKKLKDQQEGFIQKKKEHENALLEFFRGLLNNKKLKIRDLETILATAKVNAETGSPESPTPPA